MLDYSITIPVLLALTVLPVLLALLRLPVLLALLALPALLGLPALPVLLTLPAGFRACSGYVLALHSEPLFLQTVALK